MTLQARKVEGNGGRQERLPFKLFRDLLGATAGKQWLAHRLLGAGEASVMYGKPGDGKSVFAEDLGLHIAADLTWHDRRVLHGAVLYVALERRLLVERRAKAFGKYHGITDLPFAVMGGPLDFRSGQTAEYIVAVVRQLRRQRACLWCSSSSTPCPEGCAAATRTPARTWAPSSPPPASCRRAPALTSCGFITYR